MTVLLRDVGGGDEKRLPATGTLTEGGLRFAGLKVGVGVQVELHNTNARPKRSSRDRCHWMRTVNSAKLTQISSTQ